MLKRPVSDPDKRGPAASRRRCRGSSYLAEFRHGKQRHLSAEDVYKTLLEEGADIGLATAYRVLMQFEQAGLLARNHFEASQPLLAHLHLQPVLFADLGNQFDLRFKVVDVLLGVVQDALQHFTRNVGPTSALLTPFPRLASYQSTT